MRRSRRNHAPECKAYEEIYLKAYTSIADAQRSLACYFGFYNEQRRYQALNKQTPDEVCYRAAHAMAA